MIQRTGTEERIVEAAVRLFANQGYNATSTRDISRVADVSETSLFRYFSTKQDLFWVAVQSCLKRVRIRKEFETALAGDGNPELVLPMIMEFLVDISSYQPELVRLLYFGLLEVRPGVEQICRRHLGPVFLAICRYLDRCMEGGELRKVDSSITAAAFTMTILAHPSLQEVLTGARPGYANPDEATAAYSQFWLHVLMPRPERAPLRLSVSAAG